VGFAKREWPAKPEYLRSPDKPSFCTSKPRQNGPGSFERHQDLRLQSFGRCVIGAVQVHLVYDTCRLVLVLLHPFIQVVI
jgi:hypothetical protein